MNSIPLSTAEIVERTFVATAETYASISSTHDRALQLCADSTLATPALVVAAEQTAGRGRDDHHWWSPPGALLMSLIVPVDPALAEPKHRALLSLAAALAASDALVQQVQQLRDASAADAVRIKWPNDMYVGSKKIAGLLADVPHLPSHRTPRAVIGLGMNVNNSCHLAPDNLKHESTSLVDLTGSEQDIQQTLVSLLLAFDQRLRQLSTDRPALQADWQARCYLSGQAVRVSRGKEILAGICRGINSDGALLLETTEQAEPIPILSGTVLQSQ